MLHLRRAGLRLLSSSPASFVTKPRTITSFASSPARVQRQPALSIWQRRWASGEAEAKKEEHAEEAPISEIQPTPQEEVENAILTENATEVEASASASAEIAEPPTGESAETVPGSSSYAKTGSGAIESAVDAAKETVSKAASAAAGAIGMGSRAGERQFREGNRALIGEPKETIYIGNLFFDVTENDLVKELARFGAIKRCRLMRDSRGLSKGFGYVDFETTESATKAIEALNQQLFEGRRLAVQYAAYSTKDVDSRVRPDRPKGPINPPSKTLFIGNMSFEMTDRDLNNLFRGIRNVIDVRVAIDRRTGQPRGFAHADFVDVKSAMEAMKVLEDKETYGRKLRLDFSYGPSSAPRNQDRDNQGSGQGYGSSSSGGQA